MTFQSALSIFYYGVEKLSFVWLFKSCEITLDPMLIAVEMGSHITFIDLLCCQTNCSTRADLIQKLYLLSIIFSMLIFEKWNFPRPGHIHFICWKIIKIGTKDEARKYQTDGTMEMINKEW